jgi:4-oxalocrotonate tautomerase
MPFVTIKLTEGRSDEVKAKIAERVLDAVSEEIPIARDQVWVVFEDVPKKNWVIAQPKP